MLSKTHEPRGFPAATVARSVEFPPHARLPALRGSGRDLQPAPPVRSSGGERPIHGSPINGENPSTFLPGIDVNCSPTGRPANGIDRKAGGRGIRSCWALAWIVGFLLWCPTDSFAREFFLVVGGGPESWSNQVSIEHNIEFYRATMDRLRDQPREETLWFASGDGALPDVCHVSGLEVPLANRLFAAANGDRRDLRLAFRRHQLADVRGASRRDLVLDKLRALSRELGPGDRLLLYFTGHGGKGDPVSNGCFYGWNREKITVRDLSETLDRFPPETEILLVMVQCYSGTFANVLYTGGDPEAGLASHRRAGYFGTIATRPAAGCTADMKKEDYEEYSTYFWSAVGGMDRAGNAVDVGDPDGDGKRTLLDAHFHALMESPTIDISTRTSDEFLRRFGRDKGRAQAAEDGLLGWDSPYSSLVAGASPDQATLLESLSRRFELTGEDRVPAAAKLAQEIEQARKRNQSEIRRLEGAVRASAGKIGQSIMNRWPFLRSSWHPESQALLSAGSSELSDAIGGHAEFPNYAEMTRRLAELKDRDLVAERRWAGLQRMIRAAETVALAYNLQFEKDSSLRAKYEELLRLERWEVVPTATIRK